MIIEELNGYGIKNRSYFPVYRYLSNKLGQIVTQIGPD